MDAKNPEIRLEVNPAKQQGSWGLVGELDAHSAGLLEETVANAAMAEAVILDMSGVSFIDSSGLRALVGLKSSLEGSGSSMRIADPSDAVRRIIEMTGLADHLDVA